MTCKIELTRGKVAIVDDEDYKELSELKWFANKIGNTFYAVCTFNGGAFKCTKYMHRVILDAPSDMCVDHIDGNGLNNCRSNLRLSTKSQNGANRGKQADNTSGFKGVIWYSRCRKWRAQIKINGKNKFLDSFDSPEDAARAYDEAARKFFGGFAKLNFLDGDTQNES